MAQIGSIAAGILNDNDFTRFAKTPERRAIISQAGKAQLQTDDKTTDCVS